MSRPKETDKAINELRKFCTVTNDNFLIKIIDYVEELEKYKDNNENNLLDDGK